MTSIWKQARHWSQGEPDAKAILRDARVGFREGERWEIREWRSEIIEDFRAKKRIAMVGLSRQPKDFSAMLFEEL
jgi:hypothetical protein